MAQPWRARARSADRAGSSGDEDLESHPSRDRRGAADGRLGGAPALAADDEIGGIVLRRDGSKAVEVVTVPEPAARADGFDWGDAGLGAGAGVAAVLVVATGSCAVRELRGSAVTPTRPPADRGEKG